MSMFRKGIPKSLIQSLTWRLGLRAAALVHLRRGPIVPNLVCELIDARP